MAPRRSSIVTLRSTSISSLQSACLLMISCVCICWHLNFMPFFNYTLATRSTLVALPSTPFQFSYHFFLPRSLCRVVNKTMWAFHYTSFQFYIASCVYACMHKTNITREETLEREYVIIHECCRNGESVSAYWTLHQWRWRWRRRWQWICSYMPLLNASAMFMHDDDNDALEKT